LIESVATNQLKPNSIQFKKIATFVRMCLEPSKVVHVSKVKPKIMISLEEKNIDITERELMYYKQGEDEDILRAIFGMRKQTDQRMMIPDNQVRLNQEDYRRNVGYENMMNAPDDFFNNLFKMNSNVFMN